MSSIVKSIKKELGVVTTKNVVSYLTATGWKVVWFSPDKKNVYLQELRLTDYAASRDAFKCEKIVFVREGVSAEYTLRCLLHELGHITLRHSVLPTREEEEEANQFAAALLKSRRVRKPILAVFTALICVFAIIFITPGREPPSLPNTPVQYVEQADSSENSVVITKTGAKFHRSDCMYVQGKTNLLTVSIEEAEGLGAEPCKVCKP